MTSNENTRAIKAFLNYEATWLQFCLLWGIQAKSANGRNCCYHPARVAILGDTMRLLKSRMATKQAIVQLMSKEADPITDATGEFTNERLNGLLYFLGRYYIRGTLDHKRKGRSLGSIYAKFEPKRREPKKGWPSNIEVSTAWKLYRVVGKLKSLFDDPSVILQIPNREITLKKRKGSVVTNNPIGTLNNQALRDPLFKVLKE